MRFAGFIQSSASRRASAGLAAACLVSFLSVTACQNSVERSRPRSEDGLLADIQVLPLASLVDVSSDRVRALTPVDSDEEEMLRVLAACDCRPLAAAAFLTRRVADSGILNELHTPSVRDGIAGNGALKFLSGSFLGQLIDINKKIRDSVHESIEKKVRNATPGGTNIFSRVDLKFDGFAPVTSRMRDPVIDLGQQSLVWDLIFARRELFDAAAPLDGVDHGVQSVALAKSLMEWGYLTGLGQGSSPKIFGGFIVSPQSPRVINGPFVETGPTEMQFLPSRLKIDFPAADVRQYAAQMLERPTVVSDTLDLASQVLFWKASARAFSRLRPDKRTNIQPLFFLSATPSSREEDSALLPVNSHEMPLIGLGQLSGSINSEGIGFFNIESRDNRFFGAAHNRGPGGARGHAGIGPMIDLLETFALWSSAIENPDLAGLRPELLQKLQGAPPELRRGVQFALQYLFSEALYTVKGPEGESVAVLRAARDHFDPITFARGLHILYASRRMIESSPYFDERLAALTKGFIQTVLLPAVNQGRMQVATLEWARLVAKDIQATETIFKEAWAKKFVDVMTP